MGSPRIVIVGGGYAGMMLAIRLSGRLRRKGAAITLVNARDEFVERIRLQEIAVGRKPAAIGIADLLSGTGVAFRQGWVAAVDRKNRTVSLRNDAGEELVEYDTLVLANGSRGDQDAIPGLTAHAFLPEWGGSRGARALAEHLDASRTEQLRVAVVGGGASGVELSGMIKAAYPAFDVQLFGAGRIGDFKTSNITAIIRRELLAQGVALHDGRSAAAVADGAVEFADATRVECDTIVWCGGLKAPSLSREIGLDVNPAGQAITDSYLRVLNDPRIFAVGDCAAPFGPVGAPLRMSVFTATVMGAHCADNIARALKGRAMRPFSFSYYGQGIALGGRNAVGFATIPDDRPVGPVYRGRLAFRIRNFFVWYLFACLKLEKRFVGSFFWLGRKRVPAPYAAHDRQSPRDREMHTNVRAA